jgi:uncharacterized membrane-anchored protein
MLNRETMVKVPEIFLLFWIAKLGTTCFGEAFSDYIFFNDGIGRGRAITMGAVLILVAYGIQLATKRYIPLIYWFAVTAVAIFGTMSSDFLIKDLNWTLWQDTLVWLVLQATVFIVWYATEKTLSVHSITTFRREIFYWVTVYTTFALGTAAGDYVAGPLAIGTFRATLIFLAAIAIPLVGWKYFKLSPVIAFWVAYTITRPLGASFGDWLAVPAPYGDGLQIGTGPISLYSGIVLVAIIALVAVLHRRSAKTAASQEAVPATTAS